MGDDQDKLHSHMEQLMTMLYGAANSLPEDERLELYRAVADIKTRVEPLGERAALAVNIALFESRGNGFDSQE